ncbi:MAG: hypothetical protein ACJ75J_02570 [Cytophagaceae bacterium]
MEIIAHRINTVEELRQVPREFGIELDLRDYGNDLVLQHDPFKNGELFETLLREYHHGTLILNIKSERIEHRVLELLTKYNIQRYFFLDSSFPMINLLAREGEKKTALRYSEWEGLDTIENFKGRAEWIWIDCFTKLPFTSNEMDKLKSWGYKTCLVSPELQGRQQDILSYQAFLKEKGIKLDAVCTKLYNAKIWQE